MPPLTLYYIHSNPNSASSDPTLPFLTTLRPEDQNSVTRFLRLPDRRMSLASTLLKYLFIHRTAKIPWSEIIISRTPPPHKRPFWDPTTVPNHVSRPARGAAEAVEFNVSHQAGLVALAGCATSVPSSSVTTTTLDHSNSSSDRAPVPDDFPRIGIDITSPSEAARRPNPVTTASQFSDWVDIFAEIFSPAEMEDMKSYSSPPPPLPPPPGSLFTSSHPSSSNDCTDTASDGIEVMDAPLRRFYTFWALKEAYIKMTGEALLAGWLRELEFRDVRVPGVAEEGKWGQVERNVQVWFRRRRVEGLRVEVVGFGKEYIIAMVVRGLNDDGQGALLGRGMRGMDTESDVGPCAEGRCDCLT